MAANPNADCGIKIVILDSVLYLVSFCTLVARISARLFVDDERILRRINLRKLRWDDYLMCLAVLFQIGHVSSIAIAWKYGLGHHISTLSLSSKLQALKVIQVIQGFSIIPSTCARVSIALYQLRFLIPTDRKRWALITVIGINVLLNALAVIQLYAQCGSRPDALWNILLDRTKYCQDASIETNLGYVQSGFNSFCDLFLSLFPGFILWDLRITNQKKLQVYCVLATSCLALVASLVKTIQIGKLGSTEDFTWAFVQLQVWVCIEVNVILITGNFPSMYPWLRMFWREQLSSKATTQQRVYSTTGRNGDPDTRPDSTELAILKTTKYAVEVREEDEEGVLRHASSFQQSSISDEDVPSHGNVQMAH